MECDSSMPSLPVQSCSQLCLSPTNPLHFPLSIFCIASGDGGLDAKETPAIRDCVGIALDFNTLHGDRRISEALQGIYEGAMR